jgi:hypothetical protein
MTRRKNTLRTFIYRSGATLNPATPETTRRGAMDDRVKIDEGTTLSSFVHIDDFFQKMEQ